MELDDYLSDVHLDILASFFSSMQYKIFAQPPRNIARLARMEPKVTQESQE